jgi:hypothetical protein
MFIPTYKWGQTETHVVITVDAASIESHSVYPDGRCEIHGQVAGKVELSCLPLPSLSWAFVHAGAPFEASPVVPALSPLLLNR